MLDEYGDEQNISSHLGDDLGREFLLSVPYATFLNLCCLVLRIAEGLALCRSDGYGVTSDKSCQMFLSILVCMNSSPPGKSSVVVAARFKRKQQMLSWAS
eukprot:4205335-Amphidinium_carterae.1